MKPSERFLPFAKASTVGMAALAFVPRVFASPTKPIFANPIRAIENAKAKMASHLVALNEMVEGEAAGYFFATEFIELLSFNFGLARVYGVSRRLVRNFKT